MNVTLQNLGPIKEATIDLDKKLIVLCGPNNTGKTYLSYVLYAFTRMRMYGREELSMDLVDAFFDKKAFDFELNFDKLFDLYSRRVILLNNDLSTIFGLSESKVKQMFRGFHFFTDVSRTSFEEYIVSIPLDFYVGKDGLNVNVIKDANSKTIRVVNKTKEDENQIKELVKNEVMSAIYNHIVIHPITYSHFFTVERNSIYTFHKDIFSKRSRVIDEIQDLEESAKDRAWKYVMSTTSKYPLAIRQNLDITNSMLELKKDIGVYADLADEIEADILNGTLSLNDDGELLFSPNKNLKKLVPLQLSASIVKTLSSLIFYIRHICEPNNILFIDEPELNLHPDTQILLARIFGKMINRGLRLVISTHSDYIIREINNLILLSQTSQKFQKEAQKYGYSKDSIISPTDVSAYLFEYNKTKVKVNPIEVTNSGFEVRTIDEAISSLNKISEHLYFAMKYNE